MSFLAKAFGGGGSKKQQGPTPQEAIQRLRTTEEMLQKKSEHLEKKIDQELNIAKTNASKNKRGEFTSSRSSDERTWLCFFLVFAFVQS
jgi:charged multivesicular body protein 4